MVIRLVAFVSKEALLFDTAVYMPTAKLRQNIPSKQYLRQVALLQGLVTRSENLLGFDKIIVSFAEIRRVTMQAIGKSKGVDTMKPCIMPH